MLGIQAVQVGNYSDSLFWISKDGIVQWNPNFTCPLVPVSKVISLNVGKQFVLCNCEDGLYHGWFTEKPTSLLDSFHKIEFPFTAIKCIATGEAHSLILCEDGLYAMGDNTFGQLGISRNPWQCVTSVVFNQNIFFDTPKRVSFFDNIEILSIHCGRLHSLVVCKDGDTHVVYTFGHCFDSLGQNKVFEPILIDILSGKIVKNVFCTFDYTFCICEDGIYSFGNGLRCGSVSYRDGVGKTDILDGYKILHICGGKNFALFLTNNGIFGCGRNTDGQLGIDKPGVISNPEIISFLKDKHIIGLISGIYNSICICDDGFYVFGACVNSKKPEILEYGKLYPLLFTHNRFLRTKSSRCR